MPMAMENLSIAQHWNTLWYAHKWGGSYKPKVRQLMLVTLCTSSGNLMLFYTLLSVTLSWGLKRSSL
jgi:hypothetical protein